MTKNLRQELVGRFREIAHSGDSIAILGFMKSTGLIPRETELDGAYSALMLAIDSGSMAAVEVMLSHGANVAYATDQGETPFECACIIGSVRICLLLLERGANPFTRNQFGASPEDYAAQNGHLEVVQLIRSSR